MLYQLIPCVVGVLLLIGAFVSKNAYAVNDLIKADLNQDGVVETIDLVTRPTDEIEGLSANGTIIIESGGRRWKEDVGELDSVEMSSLEVVRVNKSLQPYIGLYSFGGAHGMTLTLYSWDGRKIKKEISIFSDAPSIEVKDTDGDGNNEIIAKMRDYDKDPIADSYFKKYKYKNGSWHEQK